MKTKLSGRFWCALTLFSLIGQVAWVVENMHFNVFIYNMFRATAADISAMVAVPLLFIVFRQLKKSNAKTEETV